MIRNFFSWIQSVHVIAQCRTAPENIFHGIRGPQDVSYAMMKLLRLNNLITAHDT